MEKQFELYPPIELIKNSLEPIKQYDDNGKIDEGTEYPSYPEENQTILNIPNQISELIQRRVDALNNHKDITFNVGQIREVSTITNSEGQPISAPLGILILKLEDKTCEGYAVTPFVNYANNKSVYLESFYEAHTDPIAGLIHTDLPIKIQGYKLGRTLSQLTKQRLAAVEEVAKDEITLLQDSYIPGKPMFTRTNNGHEITVGWPLNTLDAREEFIDIYKNIIAMAESSTAQQKTENLLETFWKQVTKWKDELDINMSIEDEISYAMSSNEDDSKILRLTELTISPKLAPNTSNLLTLKATNITNEHIELDLYEANEPIQNVTLEPKQSTDFYIEANQSYRIQIKSSQGKSALTLHL